MTTRHSECLARFRSRGLLTAPLAIGLLLFQTFQGELLQAHQIANSAWSLTEIPAAVPPPVTEDGSFPADPSAAYAINYESGINHSQVSPQRQQEVMAKAREEQFHFHRDAADPGTFRGHNPGHHLDFEYSASGLLVTPRAPLHDPLTPPSADAPAWSVQLRAASLLMDGTRTDLGHDAPPASGFENQTSRDLLPGCNEWFINRSNGLEHGFTIQEPPGALPDELTVEIEIATELLPVLQRDGKGVEFRDARDRIVLGYSGLLVLDNDGREVPAAMELSPVVPGQRPILRLRSDVREASFPLLIDPVVAVQIGTVRMASDGAAGDEFGTSSAGHGDWSAVSAPKKGNGVVYLYHRNQGGDDNWGEVTSLSIPESESPGTEDEFGSALAFEDDEATGTLYLIVGAQKHGGCGALLIFYLLDAAWVFLQKLAPLEILTLGALFGCSISANRGRIAVGASNLNGKGGVLLFILTAGLFVYSQLLTALDGALGDQYGYAVALFALYVLVGAPGRLSQDGKDNANAGGAYLHKALSWKGLFPLGASVFYSEHSSADDRLGTSVTGNRDSFALGIPGAALVLVFALVAGVWIHRAALFGALGSLFGWFVCMNKFGDIVVGAPLAVIDAIVAGLVFVFLLNEITLTYPTTGDKVMQSGHIDPGQNFGRSFFMLGRLLFVMAPFYNLGLGAFFQFLLTATALSFVNWMLLYYAVTAGAITDPALAHLYGRQADTDGDQIPHGVEHLLGLNPTVHDKNPLNGRIRNGLYILTLPVSLVALNALLLIQYSFNMATWFALGTGLLAGLLTTRIRSAGIAKNIMVITLAVALAQVIDPGFYIRYASEDTL